MSPRGPLPHFPHLWDGDNNLSLVCAQVPGDPGKGDEDQGLPWKDSIIAKPLEFEIAVSILRILFFFPLEKDKKCTEKTKCKLKEWDGSAQWCWLGRVSTGWASAKGRP